MKRSILLVLTIVGMMVFVAGCTEDKVVKVVGDVPAVPTGVSSTTGDQQVKVYWRGNNDNGVTEGYGVYRYTNTVDGEDQYELIGTVFASAGVVYDGDDVRWYSYIDDNVTNGVTYYYAVNAYNKWGESELSEIDAMDTPRPRGSVHFDLGSVVTGKLGFKFSIHKIIDSHNGDIFAEFDTSLQQYFIDVSNSSTLLQDFGYIDDISAIGWGDPGGGWSELGWAELLVGHGYLVFTADEHYAAIRINSIDQTNKIIYADWVYQTDTNNPELKRGLVIRPQHDANYGKRKG